MSHRENKMRLLQIQRGITIVTALTLGLVAAFLFIGSQEQHEVLKQTLSTSFLLRTASVCIFGIPSFLLNLVLNIITVEKNRSNYLKITLEFLIAVVLLTSIGTAYFFLI